MPGQISALTLSDMPLPNNANTSAVFLVVRRAFATGVDASVAAFARRVFITVASTGAAAGLAADALAAFFHPGLLLAQPDHTDSRCKEAARLENGVRIVSKAKAHAATKPATVRKTSPVAPKFNRAELEAHVIKLERTIVLFEERVE